MRKKRLLVYAMVIAAWHLLPWTVCRVTGQTAGASTLCPQPKSLKIEALSQNRAVVGWALGDGQGIPSKYQLLVKRKADDAEVKSDDALVASDNRVTIEGLEAGVEYYVRLKSDCRDSYEDVSEWSEPLYFSTLTEPKALPWGEDFDEKKEMPKGWIVTAGDVSVSSAAYHGDAGYSMLLQTDGSEPAMVVSAQTAHAADDMYFKAWVKAGKGTKYQIGLTENVADVSAFVPIYDGEVTTDNEWTEIRLGTAAYRNEVDVVGDRASFAIFLPDGVSAAVYVDDIEVTEMPECVRPEELKVEGVEATAVTLSWIGQTGVEKYEVSLTTGGVEEIREVAGSPATVTGLKPNTSYTVKVRTVCADGVESDWSTGEVGFKTSCGTAESVVQLHNFDASGELPECWVQKQTEPGYCCGEDYGDKAWVIGQDKSYSGASSLKMQQSNLETHTILAMQPVNIEKEGKYSLSFYFYRDEGYDDDYAGVRIWLNDSPDTENGEELGFLSCSGDYDPVVSEYGWHRYEYKIQRKGTVYVIFESIAGWNDQYIDDVAIEEVKTCAEIDAQTIEYKETEDVVGFEMTWSKTAEETRWVVEYELEGKNVTENKKVTVSGEPRCKFAENMTEAETYTLSGRLAAVCAEGDTSRWVNFKKEITLKCRTDMGVPSTEEFETTDRLPHCWISRQTEKGMYGWGPDYGDKAWETAESPVEVGKRAMRHLKSDFMTHTILVSPAFTIPESENWMVEMKVYRDESDKSEEGVKVWVNTSPDLEGATQLLHIQNGRTFEPKEEKQGMYDYHARIPAAGRQYLILEGISKVGSDTYVDDVAIKPMPDCMPIARDVKYDSVEHDAVRLFISEDAEWEMKYCEKGVNCDEATVQQSVGGYCRITGLTPDTEHEYDVYVRRRCDGGESEWRQCEVAFRTKCKPYEVTAEDGFADDFETLAVGDAIDDCYESADREGFKAENKGGEAAQEQGG